MNSLARTESNGPGENSSGLPLKVPDGLQVLIVCDDNSDADQLKEVLQKAGFASACAKSITAGCDAARSGQFQVVVSTPLLKDGSWRRLTDIARHYDLSFEVVLWARNFDLTEWAQAMKDGAFDVLDAVCKPPEVVEATKRALWAAYLMGAGPSPRANTSLRVA